MLISICVATYKRPKLLKELLISLRELNKNILDVSICLIIVDNDSDGSARNLVQKFKELINMPVIYEIESNRGLSHVRNKQVLIARGINSNYLAFIDDDEVIDREWLYEIVKIQKKYNADVVKGSIQPLYEVGMPEWIVTNRYFRWQSYENGHELEFTGIGNTLIKSTCFPENEKPFNERFNLSGGEDTFFFKKLRSKGKKIVFAKDAKVFEYIPISRGTIKWLLMREYRSAIVLVICEKESSNLKRLISYYPSKAVIRLIQGIILLPFSIFNKQLFIKSLKLIMRGLGTITGLLNINFSEYKKIHGN